VGLRPVGLRSLAKAKYLGGAYREPPGGSIASGLGDGETGVGETDGSAEADAACVGACGALAVGAAEAAAGGHGGSSVRSYSGGGPLGALRSPQPSKQVSSKATAALINGLAKPRGTLVVFTRALPRRA
jgi:hypothetical protein